MQKLETPDAASSGTCDDMMMSMIMQRDSCEGLHHPACTLPYTMHAPSVTLCQFCPIRHSDYLNDKALRARAKSLDELPWPGPRRATYKAWPQCLHMHELCMIFVHSAILMRPVPVAIE